MTVEFFINQYRTSNNSEEMISKHIKEKQYISFQDKIDDCFYIIKQSCWKTTDNGAIFWIDRCRQFYLFALKLIERYTDIEISEDLSKSLQEFDTLNKEGLIDILLSKIPQKEHIEYDRLLNITFEDEVTNNQSIVSYFSRMVDGIKDTLFDFMQRDDIQNLLDSKNE